MSKPAEDGWAKLQRVLQYLRGTIDLILTLGADDISNVKSWVDVLYRVRTDCKSHTIGVMSWGWGVLLSKVQKQKLNTEKLLEREIVGVSNYLPSMIWARMFLQEQGFVISKYFISGQSESNKDIEKWETIKQLENKAY